MDSSQSEIYQRFEAKVRARTSHKDEPPWWFHKIFEVAQRDESGFWARPLYTETVAELQQQAIQ